MVFRSADGPNGRRAPPLALFAAAPAPSGAADDAAASRAEAGAPRRSSRALGTTRLAEDPAWLRLGHWRKGLGGWKSEVDGREFFLAPGGKTDPAAELEATLEGLFSPGPFADELADPFCRFPARVQFLAARLGLDPAALPPRSCPKQEDFLARVRPGGVTLVFSSYYLNNPSSSFGHTLLRLDKADGALEGKHFELLDYGVDYAATVDTSNAILYAVKGLFGLFKGEFKHYAYYYKVRQYGDFESRDLWEYDLALHAGGDSRSSRATCGSSAGPGSRTGTSTRTAAITCSARSRLRRPGSISSRTSARPWSSPPTP